MSWRQIADEAEEKSSSRNRSSTASMCRWNCIITYRFYSSWMYKSFDVEVWSRKRWDQQVETMWCASRYGPMIASLSGTSLSRILIIVPTWFQRKHQKEFVRALLENNLIAFGNVRVWTMKNVDSLLLQSFDKTMRDLFTSTRLLTFCSSASKVIRLWNGIVRCSVLCWCFWFKFLP